MKDGKLTLADLTDDEEEELEARIEELLDLGESWDRDSAKKYVLEELQAERITHLRHV